MMWSALAAHGSCLGADGGGMKRSMWGAACRWPALTRHAEPLNYRYGDLKSGEWHTNGRRFRNDTGGAHVEAGKHIHLFGSIGNGGSCVGPPLDGSRSVRLGIGDHWLIGEHSMLALEAAALRTSDRWRDQGRMAHAGWRAIVEYRCRFARSWEAVATATRTERWHWRTQELALGSVWHLNDAIAAIAFVRRMDGHNGFDFTLRTCY